MELRYRPSARRYFTLGVDQKSHGIGAIYGAAYEMPEIALRVSYSQ